MWEQIKDRLSNKISTGAYQNWLSKTVFLRTSGNRLQVGVPDQETKDWIEAEYAGEVASAIRELKLGVTEVVYEIQRVETKSESAEKSDLLFRPSSLNPKFSFDNFVVGSCNQFAHAASLAVATNPARSYNPLFIYGGVGMGKTHLMHAIGRSLIDRYPGMKIVYTSSERFTSRV